MPLSDFYNYTISESDNEKVLVDIAINSGHPVFEGHFPEKPVTPGVILLDMVRHILSEITNKDLMMQEAGEIKFLSPVLPDQVTNISVEIIYQELENDYKTRCKFYRQETTFTKFKATFRAR